MLTYLALDQKNILARLKAAGKQLEYQAEIKKPKVTQKTLLTQIYQPSFDSLTLHEEVEWFAAHITLANEKRTAADACQRREL